MLRGLIVSAVLATASLASAQPHGRPAPAVTFDATGWTLLGTQEVAGKHDRDTIQVGRQEGKFDKLTLVVTDSDVELKDLTVVFANGEKWSPGGLKYVFREGQRTRAIDLPGNNRVIQKIELVYANTRRGDRAKVSVYGKDTRGGRPGLPPNGNPGPIPPHMQQPGGRPGLPPNGNPGPIPPHMQQPAFNPVGWTLLGKQTVNGRRDRDTIKVGARKGGFDQLTMVVTDSDLDLQDFTIVFTNGMRWSPQFKQVFREGSRSRVIDLPGKDRAISRIELRYANLPGGGKAKVEVYGRDVGRPAPPPFTPVTWDNKGWTLLGKKTVDGWRDRDRLAVASAKPFSEVMFVVTGSDVRLQNVVITLGNNEKFEMPSAVTFKEGTRTAPVDIPGALRRIRSIDFAYANLPGGGRAQVEVWARATPRPLPPPVPANTTPPPAQTRPPAPPPPPPAPPAGPTVRDHRK